MTTKADGISEATLIFISYPRVEREHAVQIRDAIARKGYRIFFDTSDLDAGDSFPDIIDKALKASAVVVGCWSPLAFTRPWVMKEQLLALDLDILTPAAIKPVTGRDIRVDFQGIDYADLTSFDGADSHPGFVKLMRAIERKIASSRDDARLRPGSEWRDTPNAESTLETPLMVTLPTGAFTMGAPPTEAKSDHAERPQHRVTLAYAFALSKYPITFRQWDSARSDGADLPHANDQGWGRGDRPVINVSWNDAQAYIGWLNHRSGLTGRFGYRLPSEAEWEYACRAGTQTPFFFGASLSPTQAVFDASVSYGDARAGAAVAHTQPVADQPSNGFGLAGMHGNVSEWCEDCWNGSYVGAPDNGDAWLSGEKMQRVSRGGAWNFMGHVLRSAARDRSPPSTRINYRGFRVARTF
ncbi:SUMF1/EgtB/PvdO family nonheme iron enzyme [Vitreimonas flagellata]|uniref:SUMF1/EgtB/PvdO family nonheme iron enzyme n=1 Tax=Vitreimonas flagellata TaxID=2560861 RepID=UPI00143021B6|nr:SUMF1/EgtB/PvdO family nonheme iron enzyme [Vitreimonas flagellata]